MCGQRPYSEEKHHNQGLRSNILFTASQRLSLPPSLASAVVVALLLSGCVVLASRLPRAIFLPVGQHRTPVAGEP